MWSVKRTYIDESAFCCFLGQTCAKPLCRKPVHPGSQYCCISHRDEAKSMHSKLASCFFNTCPCTAGATVTPSVSSGMKMCKTSGCTRAAYPGGDYCGKTHRDDAKATQTGQTGLGQSQRVSCCVSVPSMFCHCRPVCHRLRESCVSGQPHVLFHMP